MKSSAAMEAATAMEPSALEAAGEAMAAAEARLSAGGVGSGRTAMIEPAERAGVGGRQAVGCREAMNASTVNYADMPEIPTSDFSSPEGSAAGNVAVMVEDQPVVVPVGAPGMPPPAEPGEEADTYAE